MSPKPDGLRFPTEVFTVNKTGPESVAALLGLKFTNAPSVLPYPFAATPVPPIHNVSAVENPFKSNAPPVDTNVPAVPPVAPNAPTLPNRRIPEFTLTTPVNVDALFAPNVTVFKKSFTKPGLAESEIVPFSTISPYPPILNPLNKPSSNVAPLPPPPLKEIVTGPVYPLPGFVMVTPITTPDATVATAVAPLPPPPEMVTVGAEV
jgi:hypothetical protein